MNLLNKFTLPVIFAFLTALFYEFFISKDEFNFSTVTKHSLFLILINYTFMFSYDKMLAFSSVNKLTEEMIPGPAHF